MGDEYLSKIIFPPGELGATYAPDDGKIIDIYDEQTKYLGVKVGWFMLSIDGKSYTDDLIQQAIKGNKPYEVVFEKKEMLLYKGSFTHRAFRNYPQDIEVVMRTSVGRGEWKVSPSVVSDGRTETISISFEDYEREFNG